MADLVGPTGKVYAFEPNPNVATLLGYSLRANNFTSRAVVDRRAISDRVGMATFSSFPVCWRRRTRALSTQSIRRRPDHLLI